MSELFIEKRIGSEINYLINPRELSSDEWYCAADQALAIILGWADPVEGV